MPLTARSPFARVREMMAVSLTAGVPVGIAYGLAILWLAAPELMAIELAEHGAEVAHFPSPITTLSGAVALAAGLSLIITPLCDALARTGIRRVALASALLGSVYVLLAARAGTVGDDLSTPYLAGVGEQLRSGALLANGVLCAGLALAIPLALRVWD